ncbi:hypothetical protein [Natrialba asiatica]|uniref:Uncharacterized protein n=1 Tax=Natrialba asiatica (strain ATCC 700177 / DSM 12278 / JCM 9576 / FERM P-10747 / NBRC 102637 / 172P1) TaxID=29540 RepID=M0AI26_NATA1|nr:hypothetical protein [Natrialba asiatica]ELY97996.1 hypothetical protein C481_18710 [Natrialba asiatica DSM 12278]
MNRTRAFAITLGLLEVVAPNRIIASAERLAFENPETGRLRRWTVPIARLEGTLFVWLAARAEGPPAIARPLAAALGAAMALFPRSALEFGLAISYENAAELEVNSWVVPLTRVLGACYLVAALGARRVATPTPEENASGDD